MKRDVGTGVIAIAVVIVVAILAFAGYKTFGARPNANNNKRPEDNAAYMEHLKGGAYPQQQRPAGASGNPMGSPGNSGGYPGAGSGGN